MATNRLDLGRVRGDDGANGHPAVVEVLEETATSYVLGITYYDDGGVEHVIQTPNLKGTDGSTTFTVSSDADLQKWMSAEAGNNYTCVLVKPAAYTLSGTVDLAAAGTEAVMGFGASLPQVTLRGSGSEMVIGLEATACTDVLLVAADGSVRCSNLRGELWTLGAAENLAAPATAANYGKVRYGQVTEYGDEIAGVTPAKLRAGIRAPYNPSSPALNVIYVQGDGDDYVLKASGKISAAGFNVPSAVKRVLASLYNNTLRLHILTTDGRLFYATEQNGALSYVELASGLPTEPLTDIAYNPDTDWSSATPFPVMLTATKCYKTPTQSINKGGTECYYIGRYTNSQVVGSLLDYFMVRKQNNNITVLKRNANRQDYSMVHDADLYAPDAHAFLPEDAILYPGQLALVVKCAEYVRVAVAINNGYSDPLWSQLNNEGHPAYPSPQVQFSPDVFPDGFSASALFDDDIVGRSLSIDNQDVLLFMTAPRVLNGKLMSLVMAQAKAKDTRLFEDFYAKLVVWEGYEDFDSAAGVIQELGIDQSTQSVERIRCAVFKDNKTYVNFPAVTGLTCRETSEHKVGIGFVEKQEVDGVMEYKAGDGAVFLTKEGVQEEAASARTASVSEVVAHNSGCNRWLRFDPNNRKGLVIKGGTSVSAMINSVKVSHTFEQDTAFDLASSIGGYNHPYGRTFAVYLTDIGGQSPSMLIRLPSEQAPSNSVLLGWFSTLCNDFRDDLGALVPMPKNYSGQNLMVKPYSTDTDPDFAGLYTCRIVKSAAASEASDSVKMALVLHPLGGYYSSDILPESVWCCDFHPACVSINGNQFTGCPDAMVFDAMTGKAVDVYGMHKNPETGDSGTMQWTSSQYCDVNGAPLAPLTGVSYDVCKVSMLTVGKSLMTRADFYSASIGTPQHAALTSRPVGLGGSSVENPSHDGASGRMISFIGCEHMCGAIEQWLDEEIWDHTEAQSTPNDIDTSLGIASASTRQLLCAGGSATGPNASWDPRSGSLALRCHLQAPPNITGRGVCRVISGTRGQA